MEQSNQPEATEDQPAPADNGFEYEPNAHEPTEKRLQALESVLKHTFEKNRELEEALKGAYNEITALKEFLRTLPSNMSFVLPLYRQFDRLVEQGGVSQELNFQVVGEYDPDGEQSSHEGEGEWKASLVASDSDNPHDHIQLFDEKDNQVVGMTDEAAESIKAALEKYEAEYNKIYRIVAGVKLTPAGEGEEASVSTEVRSEPEENVGHDPH